MHVERKRIFIGNLPPCINENEIKEQFSQYGNVLSVEIKHRKDNANENVSPVFAFVNIETDNIKLQTCFQEISNFNWQGYYVKLELAKESFLERLKREREEAQTKKSDSISHELPTKIEQNNCVISTNNVNKKVYHSSDDAKTVSRDKGSSTTSDSESSDEDISEKVLENKNLKVNHTTIKNDESLIIKNNKNKILTNGKLKIDSVNSTPVQIIPPKQDEHSKKDSKFWEADEKRRKSLIQMKESYNQQKSLIRIALSKTDSKQKNKILFDEADRPIQEKNNKRQHNGNYNYDQFSKKEKLSLFTDDADDEDINFDIKKQFEGKKGQKLLELQSRFTNDSRFTLDSRFLDEETEEIDTLQNDEKQKQFDILESVLGKKIRTNHEENRNRNTSKGMVRFDPSKPEHSKFELKDKNRNENYTSKDIAEVDENEKTFEEPAIEVSKEKFYKVTDNLKQSLKENQSFSLLSMFGRAEDKDEVENDVDTATIIKKDAHLGRNPFKYDSSDTEDDEPKTAQKNNTKITKKKIIPRIISGEKLFFQNDDDRLKDGLNFLKKFGSEENSQNFSETRQELKQIIREKVKNIERKNRPFRKKLGKNKMIQRRNSKKKNNF